MSGAADLLAAQNTGRRICRDCGAEKDYLLYHRRGNTNYYQDEEGKLWSGRRCCACATRSKLEKQYQTRETYPPSRVLAERKPVRNKL